VREIKFSCTGAPVQAEGKVCGMEWYFRSRGTWWSFSVARKMWKTETIYECGGSWTDNENSEFGASWMDLRKARSLIRGCLQLYRVARPDKIGHWIERSGS
jgi:hypothetical protein